MKQQNTLQFKKVTSGDGSVNTCEHDEKKIIFFY